MSTVTCISELKAFAMALPDPVFVLSETGVYIDIVGGQDSRFYVDSSVLIGKTVFDVLPEEKAQWFLQQIQNGLNHDGLYVINYELDGREVKGTVVAENLAGIVHFEGRIQKLDHLVNGERTVVWVAVNVSKRHALEQELRRLSDFDCLSGVLSRRKIMFELAQHYSQFSRYARTCSALILDLDYFKKVNDAYGHLVGDEVLKRVAQTCQTQLRDCDLLARLGGDEFMVLLPNTEMDEVLVLAERLRSAVENLRFIDLPTTCRISVSIGASVFFAGDDRKENILERADKALYRAKDRGKNQVQSYRPQDSLFYV
ncbi:sensor domain-containing diguanylate cyclase [Alginatibacterium sediminis]|uniref:diguanylate cyclase n=1 Tax=Alginatibacterium sediminis TaxID=2164068 RepID=A0A420E9C6_9ALTE|nr:sensor domain-containing diguanylate cyclase [Alginatibacterium sediminis]RKF15933.1 sensor domain-containing diguanylate cyclase [Alginatibacterium sediminis]